MFRLNCTAYIYIVRPRRKKKKHQIKLIYTKDKASFELIHNAKNNHMLNNLLFFQFIVNNGVCSEAITITVACNGGISSTESRTAIFLERCIAACMEAAMEL